MTKVLIHTDGVIRAGFYVKGTGAEGRSIEVSGYASDVQRDLKTVLKNLNTSACIKYMHEEGYIDTGTTQGTEGYKSQKEEYKVTAQLQDYDINYNSTGKEGYKYKRVIYKHKAYIREYRGRSFKQYKVTYTSRKNLEDVSDEPYIDSGY